MLNWANLVQLQVPMWMRRPKMLAWLMLLTHEVRGLYDTYVVYRKDSIYALRITGQTIYLEKALNDRWDYVLRGIYISTVEDGSQFYFYNKVEVKPPTYLYNKFNPAHSYLVGEFAVAGTRVWKCVAGTNTEPSIDNPSWEDYGPRFYLLNKAEGLGVFDFIIWVPVAVSFDQNEMRALVNLYKLAGKIYSIQTY